MSDVGGDAPHGGCVVARMHTCRHGGGVRNTIWIVWEVVDWFPLPFPGGRCELELKWWVPGGGAC